jgi:predicted TIM-barrel fold metal-dependent hydrolase
MREPNRVAWNAGDRYIVISTDCHAGSDILGYKPYLEKKWHEEFDAWAASYSSPYDDLMWATAKRNWDSDFRMKEVDADGIAAELLFPNTVPPFFSTLSIFSVSMPRTREEYERRWAGLRAHNRWIRDFCLEEPDRRRGMLQILPHDLDAAIEEMRWAKKADVFAAPLIQSIPPNFPVEPWFHPRYDQLWAACVELAMPVVQHAGSGTPDYPDDAPASFPIMFYEIPVFANRTFGHLILGGVFERFPTLKFSMTEMRSLAWAPDDALRQDSIVADMKSADNYTLPTFAKHGVDALTLKPSEYMRRNCYHAASLDTPANYARRYEVGVDHVMWGSDYPHEEGTSPTSLDAMRWQFAGIPIDECRKILAGNAADLYGFDLDALTPIAAEIGPRVDDVSRPLAVQHDGGATLTVSMSQRPFPGGKALARFDSPVRTDNPRETQSQ